MKPPGRTRLAPSSTISSSAFFCFFGGKSKDLQKRSPEVLFIYFQLKAECWRIDAFELWCWRSLLRFSWTARRSNQSILKEISPGYSLEVLMLKLQYFGHLMWRTDWFEKTLMLGKIEGRRRRGRTEDEMVGCHHRLNGHGFGWTLGVGDEQGGLACCGSWGCKESNTTKWLSWTELNYGTGCHDLSFLNVEF